VKDDQDNNATEELILVTVERERERGGDPDNIIHKLQAPYQSSSSSRDPEKGT
jgi:hypothetical protein